MILYRMLLLTICIFLSCVTAIRYKKRNTHLPIKLIDGATKNEGYIVVNNGRKWHYQCDLLWGKSNSKVVCRELGYIKLIATYNASTIKHQIKVKEHDIYNRIINCESNENKLGQCQQKPINSRIFNKGCRRTSKVYIICDKEKEEDKLVTTLNSNDFKIRLDDKEIKSGITSSGFLHVSVKNVWKSICVDRWSYENSVVACKHLGFSTILNYHGSNDNKIDPEYLFSDLKCTGNESILSECQQKHTFSNDDFCRSTKTVHLECGTPKEDFLITEKNGELRIRGGHLESEGRVEIFKDGEWGTVCDDNWDIKDANIVCHQLGYGSAYEATHWADNGEGLGKIMTTRVNCKGSESSLKECEKSYNTSSCSHSEDAGVRCRAPEVKVTQKFRLFGGDEKEGRIEFYRNNEWFAICGVGFTRREGAVVCRQLGLGFVQWAARSYKYGISYRKGMYNVRCNGTETDLSQCSSNTWGRCRYYDMASVKCSKYAPDLVMDITTFKESIYIHSHKLRALRCSYEERCLSPIVDTFYNRYSDRKRKLLKFTSSFMNKGAVSFRSHREKSSWKWHKCHKHFHSMETFAIYDLIDNNGTRVAEGQKASFCLEDSICESGYKKVYNCTDKGDQGISVNCVDIYSNRIDCQWIDITEVVEGNYSLRVQVNPSKLISETDLSNNRAVCALEYYGNKINVTRCTTDPCYKESFGGNSYGHCCSFPFIYKGKKHYTCITDDESSNRSWCSTTHNFDKDKQWGYCKERII